LTAYRFNDAASAIYQFLWHEFCDWYVECSKLTLYRSQDPAAKARAQHTLAQVLETTLRLLHPFMPFITEEIWQRLAGVLSPGSGPYIMLARFPRASRKDLDPDAEREMSLLMEIVTAIRNIRGEMRIPPSTILQVILKPPDEVLVRRLASHVALIQALARAEVTLDPVAVRPAASAVALAGGVECYIPLGGAVDLQAERQRLAKEIRKAGQEIAFLEGKLARPEYRAKAPGEVVERDERRLDEHRAIRAKLEEGLRRLHESPV
jgi:valyl-tRNA synthetase